MALTILTDLIDSRKIQINKNGKVLTELYTIEGFNPYDVIADLPSIGSAHSTVLGVTLDNIDVTPLKALDPDSGELNRSRMVLTYSTPQRNTEPQANDNEEIWEFDMNARTVHIDSVPSKSDQLTFDADNTTGANLNNILGQDGDTIKGADVYRPTGSLRVTKYYDTVDVDADFRQGLFVRQNNVNEDAWMDWSAYQILFLGARIRYGVDADTTEVVYNFIFGSTETDMTYNIFKKQGTFTDEFTTVTLKNARDETTSIYPFEYLSISAQDRDFPISYNDPTQGKKRVRGISEISVAKVYEETSFDYFGLVGV